jgi:membrane-associated phospholipid phosphatase
VFFGVHLPLDVVGGAGVGLVCGTVAVVAFGADTTPPSDAVAASEREPADPDGGP